MNIAKRHITSFVTLSITLVVTLVSLALSAAYFLHTRYTQLAQLSAHLSQHANQMATNLSYPSWDMDEKQIMSVLEGAFSDEDIIAVQLRLDFGNFNIRRGVSGLEHDASPLALPDTTLVETRAVAKDSRSLGTLELAASPEPTLAKFRRDLIFYLFLILVIDAVLVAGLLFLLKRFILKPIEDLEKFATAYGTGGKRPQVPESTYPAELTSLRNALSEMTTLLDKRLSALEATLAELDENREFLDNIIQNIPDMVFVKEAEHLRFVRINKAGERILGMTLSDLIGRNDFDLFPKEQAEFFTGRDRTSLRTKGLVEIPEESVQTRYLGERILHTKKIPILDRQGEPKYLLGISEDITEKRDIERQLREMNQTLELRVSERTATLDNLNRELEKFSYSVSHDLRSPLRTIDGFAKLLLQDYGESLDAEARRRIEVIIARAERMDSLITGLLELAKVTNKNLVRTKVNMAQLAREAAEEVMNDDARRVFSLVIGDIPEAMGDKILLRQILHNLLSNAVKYSRQSSIKRIEIAGTHEGGECRYVIRDWGIGFDNAYADKLFKTFSRLHDERAFEGIGIGLAIVHSAVARHGGRVWASGDPDKGASFTFTIPCAEKD